MRIKWDDLLNAFDWVSGGHTGEHEAVVRKETGEVLFHSAFDDVEPVDAWPDDVEDEQKYIAVPDKFDLRLGKPLALDFAREFLPADFDEVRRMFGRKGAYAKFKHLLERRKLLDRWYEFETRATERALREWCDFNGIDIIDGDPHISGPSGAEKSEKL